MFCAAGAASNTLTKGPQTATKSRTPVQPSRCEAEAPATMGTKQYICNPMWPVGPHPITPRWLLSAHNMSFLARPRQNAIPHVQRVAHSDSSQNSSRGAAMPALKVQSSAKSFETHSTSTGRHSEKRAARNAMRLHVEEQADQGFASAPQTLEEVLDYMHDNHVLFLKRYKVGNDFQRRGGGQGFVQFLERTHDGAQFAAKVWLCFSLCLLASACRGAACIRAGAFDQLCNAVPSAARSLPAAGCACTTRICMQHLSTKAQVLRSS